MYHSLLHESWYAHLDVWTAGSPSPAQLKTSFKTARSNALVGLDCWKVVQSRVLTTEMGLRLAVPLCVEALMMSFALLSNDHVAHLPNAPQNFQGTPCAKSSGEAWRSTGLVQAIRPHLLVLAQT